MTTQQLQDNRLRLGRRIAELRNEHGMTQQQLAEATGLRQPNIARIENGKYSAGADLLYKIAFALNCYINFVEE